MKRFQEVEAGLKKELQNEKEKSYILEQSINELIRKSMFVLLFDCMVIGSLENCSREFLHVALLTPTAVVC